MTKPTPLKRRRRSIRRAVRQAERAGAKSLALLFLERFKAAVGEMTVSDYVDAVTERRDAGEELDARLLQMTRYPPGTTDPAA